MEGTGESKAVKLLGVGHSHLIAVTLAARKRRQLGVKSSTEFSAISLQNEEYQPVISSGGMVFTEKLDRVIEKELAKKPDLVFSSIAGNEHAVFGLLQQEVPYDFVLCSKPDLPVSDTANSIAYSVIKEILYRRFHLGRHLEMLSLLRKKCVCLYHLEAPPPIFDVQHILAHLDTAFQNKLAKLGKEDRCSRLDESVVAPPYLRYKLWRLQSEIFKEACEQMEISFIPAPANTMDENGFLKQQYWSIDATHGNVAYGEEVLQVLEKIAYAQ